jgi:hypothetical protein
LRAAALCGRKLNTNGAVLCARDVPEPVDKKPVLCDNPDLEASRNRLAFDDCCLIRPACEADYALIYSEMRARDKDLCRHSLYMIRPLVTGLEYLRKRPGLVDLGVVKRAKVAVKDLKLPIGHELDD